MKHHEIDIWGTANKFNNADSSVYDMVLLASLKARKIAQERNKLDEKSGRLNKYDLKPINQALKEIENDININESE
jgi:DNA-directed RNA polymerase subunit K/omega